ncbi:MAG: type III-A CRISPR-associated RAMP protein Csm5 [Saprospiraceae bacterium]
MASLNLDLYLHVITPIHVGGADDKHLVEGLDYLIRDGLVYIFDHTLLRKRVDNIEQYCNALEKGKFGMTSLLDQRHIPVDEISLKPKPVYGNPSEIKSCIKNGMTGGPYLPGSSIKGALRSIIFKKVFTASNETIAEAKNKKDKKGYRQKPEDFYLGSFKDGLMRFLQVSDVYFEKVETVISNAKIFNLFKDYKDQEWIGGWKHSNGTNDQFNDHSFTFAYECIPPASVGKFRLSFDDELFQKAIHNKEVKLPRGVKNLFGNDFGHTLKSILKNHTDEFLQRETQFFAKEKHALPETEAILLSFSDLKKQNAPEAPVFRMASGSGFHSITGDWQYEDHTNTGINPRGKVNYKSRRLIFSPSESDTLQFTPMGFAQLLSSNHYETKIKPGLLLAQQQAEAAALAQELERKKIEEEERMAAEAARQPKMRTLQEVKKEEILDGKVIGQTGLQVIVQPFVTGYENTQLLIRYPAGFPTGTIVTSKASINKNDIQLKYPIKAK